jgi:predicted transcriptional regulator
MVITIDLPPDVEARLREKAARQGEDAASVAAKVLAGALEWEAQDSEVAVEGIQRGLDDFEAGRARLFSEFAEEQRRKYGLPADR